MADGLNLFTYVGCNPARFNDDWGLQKADQVEISDQGNQFLVKSDSTREQMTGGEVIHVNGEAPPVSNAIDQKIVEYRISELTGVGFLGTQSLNAREWGYLRNNEPDLYQERVDAYRKAVRRREEKQSQSWNSLGKAIEDLLIDLAPRGLTRNPLDLLDLVVSGPSKGPVDPTRPPRGPGSGKRSPSRSKQSSGSGRTRTVNGVKVKNHGGPQGGQEIGVVSLKKDGSLGIVTATRGAGGIYHSALSKEAFGLLKDGEFRFGFTKVGDTNIFQQLSTRMVPTESQLGAVRNALNAAGLTGSAMAVVATGRGIPF